VQPRPLAEGTRREVLRRVRALILMLGLLAPAAAMAQQAHQDPRPLAFTSAQEEDRFHALAAQLRCVQCQNQSLADSNAGIAQDLRREVLVLMQEGKDDASIKRFLVARYGEFVLYEPPLRAGTVMLWLGPLLFLLMGAAVLWRLVRRRPARQDVDVEEGDGW